jgi:CHAD domain-containing protein
MSDSPERHADGAGSLSRRHRAGKLPESSFSGWTPFVGQAGRSPDSESPPMSLILPMLPLAQLLRQAAISELDAAAGTLNSPRPSEHDVHALRRSCKRLRAWLVLLREPIGEKTARAIEQQLRTLAAGLGAARAAVVLEQMLLSLADDDASVGAAVHLAQRQLDLHSRDAATIDQDSRRLLSMATIAIAELPLRDIDATMLERGLIAGYRRAHHAMHDAVSGEAKAMHEWRRKLRRHTDHSRLLSPLWPALWQQRRKLLKRLNDQLGEHHDLQDLDAALAMLELKSEHADALHRLIEKRQHDLASRCAALGDELFRIKAGRWSPARC